MMKNLFFCVFLLAISFEARTQIQKQTQESLSPEAEQALRVSLATELIAVLRIEAIVQENIGAIPAFIKRSSEKENQSPAVAKKIAEESQAKYDSIKTKIPQDIQSQLVKELTLRYSSTELKYLVEINKYPLYKKFKNFLESDQYYSITGKAFSEANRVISEVKRKTASESAPVKVNPAKAPSQ